jgi:uncharacterized phosphosugar-binding protein
VRDLLESRFPLTWVAGEISNFVPARSGHWYFSLKDAGALSPAEVQFLAFDIRAAVSTFANAFALNCLVIRTVALLAERGIEPPVWRSGNAPGGDQANARFLGRFRGRVRSL